jgi:hypothetical protein
MAARDNGFHSRRKTGVCNLSVHGIAAGTIPNKTNTENETTNNKCIGNFICKMVMLGSRKLHEFIEGYTNANKGF